MPSSAWAILKDLGILGAVGAAVLLIVTTFSRVVRAQWAAHKLRGARITAHLEATDVLLEDALHRPQVGEIRAAGDRAAREERLTKARERLARCSPRKSSR